MSIYAIGDTHLSLSTDKPMNIFKGWENYVERLSAQWQEVVRESDTVVVMGDVSWGMSLEEAKADLAFINALPGQKLILKGNHDYWWNTKRKMDAFFAENGLDTLHILHNNAYRIGDWSLCGTRGWFYDDESAQQDKVLLREVQRLKTSIDAAKDLGGEPIVFLHYPPISTAQQCAPFLDLLRREGIRRCYYAHMHGPSTKLAFCGEAYGIKFELLSADHLKFCPKLIELINS